MPSHYEYVYHSLSQKVRLKTTNIKVLCWDFPQYNIDAMPGSLAGNSLSKKVNLNGKYVKEQHFSSLKAFA